MSITAPFGVVIELANIRLTFGDLTPLIETESPILMRFIISSPS